MGSDPLQTARRKVGSQLPLAHTPSVYAALLMPDISFIDGEAKAKVLSDVGLTAQAADLNFTKGQVLTFTLF